MEPPGPPGRAREEMKKVIYLSHPYRSATEWGVWCNIQSAHTYAKQLWRKGWAVISPVSNTAFMGDTDDFDVWMSGDLEILSRCDAIAMSPGWERSEGCRMEYSKAVELGMAVYNTEEVPNERESGAEAGSSLSHPRLGHRNN